MKPHVICLMASSVDGRTLHSRWRPKGVAGELFERVHAPVGLDIGAVTPEEIAVAITAELIAVRRRVERDLPHMSWFHRLRSAGLHATNTAEENTEAVEE